MINIIELTELVKLIEKSSIDTLELTHEGARLHLKKGRIRAEAASLQALPTTAILETARERAAASDGAADMTIEQSVSVSESVQEIVSDWVGAFHSTLKVGDRIEEGQIVCHCRVNCLTITHEIISQVSGEIIDILVENGQFVDYGQPLLIVKVDPRRKNNDV